MNNYKNKNVLIWGLGLNGGGLGMAKYFAKAGANVLVTDLKTKKQLAPSIKQLKKYKNIKYNLGANEKKDFLWADIIVQNPAIPPTNELLKFAKSNKKQLIIELLYVIKHFKGKIIGVTGTKGKSTTTTLIKHILGNKNVFVGGNLQTSTIEILNKSNSKSIAVLEVPSFQLHFLNTIKKSPNIAVITNIGQDHINWHGSLKNYQHDKKNIYKYQNTKDIAVLNIDDKVSSKIKITPGKKITVSSKNKDANYLIKNNFIYCKGKKIVSLKKYQFKGTNHLLNAAQAVAVAKQLKIKNSVIQKKINSYKGINGRQQLVKTYKGIKFINDTTATAPVAIKTAIEGFSQYKGKIILISGGVDKNIKLPNLKNLVQNNVKAVVMFEGSGSQKLYKNIKQSGVPIYKYFNTMQKAVEKAVSIAKKGDVVILCPGFASFNMFNNEFDRGEQFINQVNKLK